MQWHIHLQVAELPMQLGGMIMEFNLELVQEQYGQRPGHDHQPHCHGQQPHCYWNAEWTNTQHP